MFYLFIILFILFYFICYKCFRKLSRKYGNTFLELQCVVATAGTDTETVINKLSKQELVQLIFNTEANVGVQFSAAGIKD